MIRALYSSATGMKAQELMLDVTANNIANVNTNGFKRSHIDFADLLYATYQEPGTGTTGGPQTPIGLQVGSGVRAVGTTKFFTPGPTLNTGGRLDVALSDDNHLFKIQLPNGDFRYTRDGAFHTDGTGQIVTGDGYLVVGAGTAAGASGNDVRVTKDGKVVVMGDGGNSTEIGALTIVTFANPAGLSSDGGNLYAATPAAGDERTVDAPTVQPNMLEQSNVEVVTELVALITAQRAYEVNSRAIRAGDEMLSNTNDILR